jgi:hypothetical protein
MKTKPEEEKFQHLIHAITIINAALENVSSMTTFFAELEVSFKQGCVIVALRGCVIVALQICVIVVLQGCMIVVLQSCVIVALQGWIIVVLQGCVIVVLQGCVIFSVAYKVAWLFAALESVSSMTMFFAELEVSFKKIQSRN